jgi:outer membrane protein assembly factor BamD
MRFHWRFLLLLALLFLVFPKPSPAPLIYQPGEGWTYQGAAEIMDNPKDQLELGKKYEGKKNWDDAIASYLYILRKWPTSEQAQEAQYRIGLCREGMRDFYKAFLSYQRAINKWPSHPRFEDMLERMFKIGNLFLAGERQKVWRIKTLPSMDKTVEIYEGLIRAGPQSKWAPQAQFNIGLAREKQRAYDEAVLAYQKLIDRYPDSLQVETAYYQIGAAYANASRRAEYDKSAADKAVEAFQEYLARYPQGDKAMEAKRTMAKVRAEQARGLYEIARFYDKQKKSPAALIYYNDLITHFPDSKYTVVAKQRVEQATRASTN